MTQVSQDKVTIISSVDGVEIEETATIIKYQGDKVYCRDDFGNDLFFSKTTGYCYTDNPTFNSKLRLKV